MTEGAFILRISGSQKSCLALSIRIPVLNSQHQPTKVNENGNNNFVDQVQKIAHYLIVQNENGFIIKVKKKFY